MSRHETFEAARYLEDLERVQTDILSDPYRTYRAFREVIARDPQFWEQRADHYASRFDADEADMRLQQDFVDHLVMSRAHERKEEIAALDVLIMDDPEPYSGLLAQMAILDSLGGRDVTQPA